MYDHGALVLERFCYSDSATFGRMSVEGRVLYTVERPWVGNLPRVSCIPEGTYRCRPRPFFRGGYDAVEVCNVPGRTHILFHRGNRAVDVLGCIAVGAGLGVLGSDWAVLKSAEGFQLFMEAFGGKNFTLAIRGVAAGRLDAGSGGGSPTQGASA